MNKFEIDIFELLFLAEACIPPKPAARSMFWDNLCDKYYHQMSDDNKLRMYEWLLPDIKDKKNEDCKHFLARYNPDNQYKISQMVETSKGKMLIAYDSLYLFNGDYHINKYQMILKNHEKYIEKK